MLFGLICVFDFDEFDSYRTNLYKSSFDQTFSKLHLIKVVLKLHFYNCSDYFFRTLLSEEIYGNKLKI